MKRTKMRLLGIQTGQPSQRPAEEGGGKAWTTGFFKTPLQGSVEVGLTNLDGDGQADLRNHGGPDKAICLYPSEHGPLWREELGIEVEPGGFGENFTTEGLCEKEVCLGDVFSCGSAELQVSQPRQPCWKLARRWGIRDLALRVERTGRTGWYFRVLVEGRVQAPEDLVLLTRPHPEWPLALANEIMHHRKTDWQAAGALAACPALSASWRRTLSSRAKTQLVADSEKRQFGA